MFSRGLATELRWLALVIGASAIIGVSADALHYCLIVGLLVFIFRLLFCLSVLEKWVAKARRADPPSDDFGGIWGEIADDVRLLCKRYQKDKIRLQAVVTRIQDMTSALSDGVILVDNRDNIEWWNLAAQRLIGFHDVDRGHRLINIIRNPRFITYFENRDYGAPLELESLRREGQFLEFDIHMFGQGERLVVVRDVSRVRRLEQMRKDFVSNVSHELRTPLTVIKGYIETLLDAPDTTTAWRGALPQMLQQSDRMTALVHDLITLSRLETDQTESKPLPVSVAPLIRNIIADAKAMGGDRHDFAFTGDTSVALLGSEQELHSALSNLIYNAVKYSPEGGKIAVDISLTQRECVISVSDTGVGIDPKHLPRITERFYRVDEGRSSTMGGTGLGLAIVKHVLMRHDAELKIESKPGSGSTFSCRFPVSRVVSRQVA